MLNITGKDAPRLSENIMREYSLDYCVVTLGEKGAFALSRKGEGACVPGYKIDVVDSVGAGDAFAAGFAYCILRDLPLSEACELGNIMGALVSATKGATAPITKEEIESFTSENVMRIHDKVIEETFAERLRKRTV